MRERAGAGSWNGLQYRGSGGDEGLDATNRCILSRTWTGLPAERDALSDCTGPKRAHYFHEYPLAMSEVFCVEKNRFACATMVIFHSYLTNDSSLGLIRRLGLFRAKTCQSVVITGSKELSEMYRAERYYTVSTVVSRGLESGATFRPGSSCHCNSYRNFLTNPGSIAREVFVLLRV